MSFPETQCEKETCEHLKSFGLDPTLFIDEIKERCKCEHPVLAACSIYKLAAWQMHEGKLKKKYSLSAEALRELKEIYYVGSWNDFERKILELAYPLKDLKNLSGQLIDDSENVGQKMK